MNFIEIKCRNVIRMREMFILNGLNCQYGQVPFWTFAPSTQKSSPKNFELMFVIIFIRCYVSPIEHAKLI